MPSHAAVLTGFLLRLKNVLLICILTILSKKIAKSFSALGIKSDVIRRWQRFICEDSGCTNKGLNESSYLYFVKGGQGWRGTQDGRADTCSRLPGACQTHSICLLLFTMELIFKGWMEKETKWNKTTVDLDLSKTSLLIEKGLEANPADSRSKGSGWDTCQMPYLA